MHAPFMLRTTNTLENTIFNSKLNLGEMAHVILAKTVIVHPAHDKAKWKNYCICSSNMVLHS
ncbi:MAG: hypothetical protein ACI865_001178 [Flavobacteriaceae bacterium]|jgi:hypothetical protein